MPVRQGLQAQACLLALTLMVLSGACVSALSVRRNLNMRQDQRELTLSGYPVLIAIVGFRDAANKAVFPTGVNSTVVQVCAVLTHMRYVTSRCLYV